MLPGVFDKLEGEGFLKRCVMLVNCTDKQLKCILFFLKPEEGGGAKGIITIDLKEVIIGGSISQN